MNLSRKEEEEDEEDRAMGITTEVDVARTKGSLTISILANQGTTT
jgi:hypothetical protein